jgi:hypothetical protein
MESIPDRALGYRVNRGCVSVIYTNAAGAPRMRVDVAHEHNTRREGAEAPLSPAKAVVLHGRDRPTPTGLRNDARCSDLVLLGLRSATELRSALVLLGLRSDLVLLGAAARPGSDDALPAPVAVVDHRVHGAATMHCQHPSP